MRYRIPDEWTAAGASFGRDGLLYFAEWRRGFTPGELRALFFDCQQVSTLRRELDAARRDLAKAQADFEVMERRAWWLRRQLVRESRLGAILTRLGDDPAPAGQPFP